MLGRYKRSKRKFFRIVVALLRWPQPSAFGGILFFLLARGEPALPFRLLFVEMANQSSNALAALIRKEETLKRAKNKEEVQFPRSLHLLTSVARCNLSRDLGSRFRNRTRTNLGLPNHSSLFKIFPQTSRRSRRQITRPLWRRILRCNL